MWARGSHHPSGLDALLDVGLAHLRVLGKLAAQHKVLGQVDLDAVLLGFLHQFVDDLGSLLIVERVTDLSRATQNVK